MSRSTRITRALTAALAITALAAPTAFARPVQDLRSPDAKDAAAQARTLQDLRSPDAKDAAAQARTLQDLRSPDARDAAMRPQQRVADRDLRTSSLAGTTSPKGGVYWSYDYAAEIPASARPAPVRVTDDDTNAPWLEIGIAIAAAMLGATGGAFAASRTRRSRVAA
jgi:hypothetical protein